MTDIKQILICHAPEDNRPVQGAGDGWVTTFAQKLKNRLGEDNFSVKTALPDSAVSMSKHAMVIVLSPFFLDALENDPDYGDFRKMILKSGFPMYIVEIAAIDESLKPAKIRKIPVFRFWDERGYFNYLDDLYRQVLKDFSEKKSDEVLPDKAKKVFICYAKADFDTAKQVYDDLKKQGIEPWMEAENLKAGEHSRFMIRQAIKSAGYFIALFSKNSLSKGDYHRQQKIALDLLDELPQSDVFVIPVRIDDCDPGDIHSGFVNIHTADLFPTYETGMQKILKTLGVEDSQSQVQVQALEKPDIRKAVYLAEVSPDLFKERDEVRRYLDQQGYKVIPEKSLYHHDFEQYKFDVEQALKRCGVFVQLLSLLTCRMSAEHPCYGKIQHECAKKSNIPVMQWRSTDINPGDTDENHQELLEGESVFAVHLEEFKREVKDSLAKPKAVVQDSGDDGSQVFVYVNADEKDVPLAEKIALFMESSRIGYALPGEDEKDERFEEFKEHLEICDGVIVVYGQADVKWARRQLLECRKVTSRSRTSLVVIAVYEGPPEKKKPLNYKLPNMVVLDDCRSCMNPELFEPFFRAMREKQQRRSS
ncbi:toll/interleukin-1 receptor domain-containing protein [Desulfobacterales bacterium HSG17]|nr:toll/interleukin-1 receptor domain-containing protein [Desulfobacterales bacterium HSG17]